MEYHDFVGQVQHRAQLPSDEDAVRAIRVTLETLSERLSGGAPANLAAQLPREIGLYLLGDLSGIGERMSLREFYELVAHREGVKVPTGTFHARAVVSVLCEAV